jgi:hypothetical protein
MTYIISFALGAIVFSLLYICWLLMCIRSLVAVLTQGVIDVGTRKKKDAQAQKAISKLKSRHRPYPKTGGRTN